MRTDRQLFLDHAVPQSFPNQFPSIRTRPARAKGRRAGLNDEVSAMTTHDLHGLQAQLDEMRTMILRIHEKLDGPREARTWYTVSEAAKLLGRKRYTVREWCRHGRINAVKRSEKRGDSELWSISSDEIARYQDKGLLPERGYREVG